MDEARSRPGQETEHESQVRRAQRGVVAGYIHEVSERHGGPLGNIRGTGPSGRAPRVRLAVTAPSAEGCLPAEAARPGRTGSRALWAEPGKPARG